MTGGQTQIGEMLSQKFSYRRNCPGQYGVYWWDITTAKKDALLCVIEGSAGAWTVPMPNPKDTLGPFKTRDQAIETFLKDTLGDISEQMEQDLQQKKDRNPHRKTRRLTKDQAEYIYNILITECGAGWRERERFVYAQADMQQTPHEYRFCGALGFGGKFWNVGSSFYVNCYREDQTPMILYAIAEANLMLQQFYVEEFDGK